MSGKHEKHIKDKGLKCTQCHGDVVDAARKIIAPDLHVNGVHEVKLVQGTFDPANRRCTGLGSGCHGTKDWR